MEYRIIIESTMKFFLNIYFSRLNIRRLLKNINSVRNIQKLYPTIINDRWKLKRSQKKIIIWIFILIPMERHSLIVDFRKCWISSYHRIDNEILPQRLLFSTKRDIYRSLKSINFEICKNSRLTLDHWKVKIKSELKINLKGK